MNLKKIKDSQYSAPSSFDIVQALDKFLSSDVKKAFFEYCDDLFGLPENLSNELVDYCNSQLDGDFDVLLTEWYNWASPDTVEEFEDANPDLFSTTVEVSDSAPSGNKAVLGLLKILVDA